MIRTTLLTILPTATGLLGLLAFRAFHDHHTLLGVMATATATATAAGSIAIYRFAR